MRVIQCFGGFQFDQKRFLDHQIDDVFANRHAIVNDGKPMLLRDGQSSLAQLMGQGIFVDFLQKPGSERLSTVNAQPMTRPDRALSRSSSACLACICFSICVRPFLRDTAIKSLPKA